jgi:hypothetical protein
MAGFRAARRAGNALLGGFTPSATTSSRAGVTIVMIVG